MRQEHRTQYPSHALLKTNPGYDRTIYPSATLSRVPVSLLLSLLSQRRLRLLGHVRRMEDGRNPKNVLYGQLVDTCKYNMKACKIDTDTWEAAVGDLARWRQKVKQGIEHAGSERGVKAADKRARRKLSCASATNTPTSFICSTCSRDF